MKPSLHFASFLAAVVASLASSHGFCQNASASTSESAGARSYGIRAFDPVAKIQSVSGRDHAGRVNRFRDSGNREFEIVYDVSGRVTSCRATAGAHVSDVLAIGYDQNGRLIGAELGSGYSLHVNYTEDETQVIRDRYGGLIARKGNIANGYLNAQVSDPTGRLVLALAGLDDLLRHSL